MEKIKVRWLIAHFPTRLFIRTAAAFRKELEKTCPEQFEIEILTAKKYVDKYDDLKELKFSILPLEGLEQEPYQNNFTPIQYQEIKKKWNAVFQGFRADKFELTQLQVHLVGAYVNKDFHVLDFPFLFEDHDHVSKVLDGEIGAELCRSLSNTSKIQGLAFTYSGGYRIIGSKTPIADISELKSIVSSTPLTHKLFQNLGTETYSRTGVSHEEIADAVGTEGGAIETTYIRFAGKNVLKTNHSMFLTVILASDKFMARLTAEQQVAFKAAAKAVAKLERQWSIADADEYEKTAVSKGILIQENSPEGQAKLKAGALELEKQVSLQFGPLIKKIRDAAN